MLLLLITVVRADWKWWPIDLQTGAPANFKLAVDFREAILRISEPLPGEQLYCLVFVSQQPCGQNYHIHFVQPTLPPAFVPKNGSGCGLKTSVSNQEESDDVRICIDDFVNCKAAAMKLITELDKMSKIDITGNIACCGVILGSLFCSLCFFPQWLSVSVLSSARYVSCHSQWFSIKVLLLTKWWEKYHFSSVCTDHVWYALLFLDNICSPNTFEDLLSVISTLCSPESSSESLNDYKPSYKRSDLLGQFHSRTWL